MRQIRGCVRCGPGTLPQGSPLFANTLRILQCRYDRKAQFGRAYHGHRIYRQRSGPCMGRHHRRDMPQTTRLARDSSPLGFDSRIHLRTWQGVNFAHFTRARTRININTSPQTRLGGGWRGKIKPSPTCKLLRRTANSMRHVCAFFLIPPPSQSWR